MSCGSLICLSICLLVRLLSACMTAMYASQRTVCERPGTWVPAAINTRMELQWCWYHDWLVRHAHRMHSRPAGFPYAAMDTIVYTHVKDIALQLFGCTIYLDVSSTKGVVKCSRCALQYMHVEPPCPQMSMRQQRPNPNSTHRVRQPIRLQHLCATLTLGHWVTHPVIIQRQSVSK